MPARASEPGCRKKGFFLCSYPLFRFSTSNLKWPLSGAMFMLDWLPSSAREVLLYVPMVNCVELLREGYFGSLVHAYYDIGYVVAVSAVLNLLALAQERRISRSFVLE